MAQGYSSAAAATAFYHWKWDEGIALARQATELNPSSRVAWHIYGACLLAGRRAEEAQDCFERALALDPLSVQAHRTLGWALYLRRRLAGAEKWLEAALAIHSEPAQTKYLLGQVLIGQHRYEEAFALAQQIQSDPPEPLTLGLLGACFAHLKREPEAVDVVNKLRAMQVGSYVDPYAKCQVLLALNHTDAAIESVQECLDERIPLAGLMEMDPSFDPLRGDDRFRKLMTRVHS
jgi:tetratricopeptide (TPR) repeat protein